MFTQRIVFLQTIMVFPQGLLKVFSDHLQRQTYRQMMTILLQIVGIIEAHPIFWEDQWLQLRKVTNSQKKTIYQVSIGLKIGMGAPWLLVQITELWGGILTHGQEEVSLVMTYVELQPYIYCDFNSPVLLLFENTRFLPDNFTFYSFLIRIFFTSWLFR